MALQITLPDLSEILFAREYAYDILRRFFIEEPSKEYFKHFEGEKMYTQFPFKDDSKGIVEGITDIAAFFDEYDPVRIENHFEQLQWDYTRLLIGPFEMPAPPWESVYVRKDKLLFQESTLRVRNEYKKYGFKASEFDLETDDHVGFELDFMYHLNNMCLSIAKKNTINTHDDIKDLLIEQQKFLDEHLLTYITDFADNVVEHAETKFYKGLAKVLKHFIKIDSQVLKELLNIEMID